MNEDAPVHIVHMKPGDEARIQEAEPLFDDPVDLPATRAFLADERHHLLIAYTDKDEPGGFVSAVELLHPDEPKPEMFLNELGVEPAFQRRGIATALMQELIELCRSRGCSEMWVGTEETNTAAMRTYRSTGGKREAFVLFTYEIEEHRNG
ncbi:MAG: GNAT family N-acetyltransferase [Actinomycetota bacterium]|nr:GNAT family N-acetyltransferase [Actinomycetota bacterium]